MVRFIINVVKLKDAPYDVFTFQYGQIYYYYRSEDYYLICLFTFQYGQIYYSNNSKKTIIKNIIYIPIWLDLLSADLENAGMNRLNLHSNMVRFIIHVRAYNKHRIKQFTFQYGQIYY